MTLSVRSPLPVRQQAEYASISPEHVRISTAAAIELGLVPGRIQGGCGCGCINLLQTYATSCLANCGYCGLARERPGLAEDKSFIRVDWPVFPTNAVADRIAERDAQREVGRVCVAQVHDRRAYDDLIDMVGRVHARAPKVPISALVSASLLDDARLEAIRTSGVDIVGIGLDAASPAVFDRTRGRSARSPHDWDHHWEVTRSARRIFGPMRVNCHVVVGLGESDRDLVDLFHRMKAEQIACYLFSFNPEPGTAMADAPRAPLERLRRVQLIKYLIEQHELAPSATTFDDTGALALLDAPDELVRSTARVGLPFMTNGCPDRHGVMSCNRPYGSYRPGEPFRDYPFLPEGDELHTIWTQMRLEDVWHDRA